MNILFVHQNFPGQFKFLVPELAQQGHQVSALTMRKVDGPACWPMRMPFSDWDGMPAYSRAANTICRRYACRRS